VTPPLKQRAVEGAQDAETNGREYRVAWQREGQRPRHKIYQSWGFAERYRLILEQRFAEVFSADPDAFACCSGVECGCGGLTNAEQWANSTVGIPPLIGAPTLERRAVGGWAPFNVTRPQRRRRERS
jgi:hypothetical protein